MIFLPKHAVYKKNLKIDSYARLLLSLAEVFKGPFFVFFAEGGGGGRGSRCSYLNLEGWLTDFSPRSLGVFHFTTLGKKSRRGKGKKMGMRGTPLVSERCKEKTQAS